jgi:hypothetical protein
MAQFLTRVELHMANAEDYQRLHEAMETRRFSRTIVDNKGVRYHLPTAEYYSFGEIDANSVADLAKGAVAAIGKTGAVITANFVDARWNGLLPV